MVRKRKDETVPEPEDRNIKDSGTPGPAEAPPPACHSRDRPGAGQWQLAKSEKSGSTGKLRGPGCAAMAPGHGRAPRPAEPR